MENPLVSIIIPTYNRAHLIGETLDSVLAQTYTNWECIVVDDGSMDNTDDVLKTYCDKDARFQYHKRPDGYKPGGNGARNCGFLQSIGKYIQWFDSDDIMYEDHLRQKVAAFQEDNTIDVVFCAYHYFDINGLKNRISNNYFSGDIIKDKIEKKINYSTHSFMLCRKALGEIQFDETLFKSQDLDFFFRLFTTYSSLKLINIKIPLYKIRKHKNQISQTVSKNNLELKSKYRVHKNMVSYFSINTNFKGISTIKKQSHYQLKELLENRNFGFVFTEITRFGFYSLNQKIRLVIYFFIYVITGKGINRFKNVL